MNRLQKETDEANKRASELETAHQRAEKQIVDLSQQVKQTSNRTNVRLVCVNLSLAVIYLLNFLPGPGVAGGARGGSGDRGGAG